MYMIYMRVCCCVWLHFIRLLLVYERGCYDTLHFRYNETGCRVMDVLMFMANTMTSSGMRVKVHVYIRVDEHFCVCVFNNTIKFMIVTQIVCVPSCMLFSRIQLRGLLTSTMTCSECIVKVAMQ